MQADLGNSYLGISNRLYHREGNCTYSSTLAWKIPGMGEPGGLQPMGSLRVRHNWATSLSLSCIGEGNSNPLQYSFLENLRDRGAWWAAVYGVTQSRTWLKWLSSNRLYIYVYMPCIIILSFKIYDLSICQAQCACPYWKEIFR